MIRIILLIVMLFCVVGVGACDDDNTSVDGSDGDTDGDTDTDSDADSDSDGDACAEGESHLCGITAAHNRVRADVEPVPDVPLPALSWSSALASTAQDWADNCDFAHSGQGGVGENIFMGTTGYYDYQDVVDSWASEVEDYNYGDNSCSAVCGHYTQIVWRDTLEVGCGRAECSSGMDLWVCQYSPPGNWVGEKPY